MTPPIGVFCVNDYVAVGIYRTAQKLGWTVGKDIFVVGFDDDPDRAGDDPGFDDNPPAGGGDRIDGGATASGTADGTGIEGSDSQTGAAGGVGRAGIGAGVARVKKWTDQNADGQALR